MTSNCIETVQCVYFSPTGTTRKTVETIAEGTGLRIADPIDITLPAPREEWDGSTQGAILVVGVPVYAGTLPSHTLDPLHRLEGNGRWAVPVAVYGMRSAEDTVEQLSGLLRTRGFKILAAANFYRRALLRPRQSTPGTGETRQARPGDR